jgi:phenylpropionate dioxygenase-like ring-hydroxylating dioxygenase large terminal subunit
MKHGGANAAGQSSAAGRTRLLSRPVPAEGEGGLFSQTWYPICLSGEVTVGSIVGKSFLGGRVVAFRDEDGIAQVLSAYCPHLGADLAVGCVVKNSVRCAFHHWQFDRDGICVRTGTGDPPPPGAVLFNYPTVERYGIVWAFNGTSPLFSLPDLVHPDEELEFKTLAYPEVLNVDPWVVYANTPDLQHLRVVHGFVFEEDTTDRIEWTDHSLRYQVRASVPTGDKIDFDVSVIGTNIFRQIGTLNGRWFAFILTSALPEPGKSSLFFSVATRKSEGDEASRRAFLDGLLHFETGIVEEDLAILQSIRFKPGTMAKSDKALIRYFDYVRTFPRANPGAEFLR